MCVTQHERDLCMLPNLLPLGRSPGGFQQQCDSCQLTSAHQTRTERRDHYIYYKKTTVLFIYLSQLFNRVQGARDAATLNCGTLTEHLATLLCSPAFQTRGNSSHYWKYTWGGGHSRKTSRKSNSCNSIRGRDVISI